MASTTLTRGAILLVIELTSSSKEEEDSQPLPASAS